MSKSERLKVQKPEIPHCVQCGQPMLMGTNWDKFVPICDNPTCPNYGILQVGIEKMQELEERKAK
jgi:hypothetical protein